MSSGLEGYLEQEDQDGRSFRSRSFWRLMRLISRHQRPFWAGIALVLLGTFATLLEPRLFGYAIDEAIVPKDWPLLVRLASLFFVVTCVRVAAVIGQGYLFELLGQRVTQALRVELFAHLQKLPVSAHDRNPAGRLLTRVTNDIGSLSEMFSAGFVSMLSNFLLVVGILAWLLALNLKLGLIAIAVFPVLLGLAVYFTRLLRGSYRESRSKLSALNAFLAENLSGMKVVHLFNRQKLHLERFDRVNQWYTDSLISTIRVYAFFQPSITIASGISMALLIGFGGHETLSGELQVGVLVAFFSYALSLFQPVREIADKWNVFLSGLISAERVFAILEWPTEMKTDEAVAAGAVALVDAKPIEGLRGHIVFENVWFAYEATPGSERWVLQDFSLEIQPGMKVGVVGHTGAGKTTLISLLMRFYDPQRGRILLDGKDLRDYDKRALRASIGIIQQDAFVFSGTLADNITFWRDSKSAGAQAAASALRTLGYDRWLASDAPALRERGSNLSMGEKQVLAFARAIASQPQVWILDEATANMDSRTEQTLSAELARASDGRTSILIAHRLATVQTADLILVLHRGRLQEKGSHDELVSLDGLYARLHRYQQAQQQPARAVRRRVEESQPV